MMKNYLRLGLIIAVLACVFGITACGSYLSNAEYTTQIMNKWIGMDVNNLISRLGPPSDVYTMPNGNKMYSWLWMGGTTVVTNYNYWLNQAVSGSTTSWCKGTWTANTADIIIASSWTGSNCSGIER
jgi:hypothetical protein